MTKAQNIFLIGPMGAGKTTIGRYLAKELNFTFYDSDKEIEKRSGADIPWIFDVEGEVGFRKREEQVIAELTLLPEIVLATGGGSILSSHNRTLLAGRGIVVYLHVSLEQQLARIAHAKDRPLLTDQPDPQETLKILQMKREPYYREVADIVIHTDQLTPRTISQMILDKLQEPLVDDEENT